MEMFSARAGRYLIMSQRNRLSKPKKKPKKKPKRKQDFFKILPSEIIIDILSRLPVRTIISCKCVCKPWLSLLETDEFAKTHLSKSVSGVAVNGCESCKIFEFDNELDLEHHDQRYIPVTSFDCSECGLILGSANGLLFLHNPNLGSDDLNIINPVTQYYIRVPDPRKIVYGYHEDYTYGFGVSRITGQYKLIRIFHVYPNDEEFDDTILPGSCGQVYTLGTRLWRRVTPGPILEYNPCCFGASFNGNIHWLVFDLDGCPWISCFDLEDELFSIFPSPPALPADSRSLLHLCALEDRLCLSDNVSDDEFVIWFLKGYGVKTSWTKDFVISKSQIPKFHRGLDDQLAYPVKVFKDGDILMAWGESSFFYYSIKTKTTHKIGIFKRDSEMILHTPSFLSLKNFAKEKVRSFR